eukprot:6972273-Prymnesium_polylepis.1
MYGRIFAPVSSRVPGTATSPNLFVWVVPLGLDDSKKEPVRVRGIYLRRSAQFDEDDNVVMGGANCEE